jgi:hypothetical protein
MTMPSETALSPAQLWTQAMQTWTEAWTAATPATRTQANGAATPADPFALWRRASDQWLAGWTALLEGTFQTPEAAAASGRLLDTMLNIEKPLRERTAATMEFWLEFFNLPSRGDLIRVATQLNDANARLDELHDQVEDLSDQMAEMKAALKKATAQTVK